MLDLINDLLDPAVKLVAWAKAGSKGGVVMPTDQLRGRAEVVREIGDQSASISVQGDVGFAPKEILIKRSQYGKALLAIPCVCRRSGDRWAVEAGVEIELTAEATATGKPYFASGRIIVS